MIKSGGLLIVFAILMIVTLSGTLFYIYSDLQKAYQSSSSEITLQLQKKQYISKMYSSARERTLILLRMYRTKDAFELDDLNQELGVQARIFIQANANLKSLKLSDFEREKLKQQRDIRVTNSPLQNRVAELFVAEEYEQAEKLLFNEAMPGQDKSLKKFSDIIRTYEIESQLSLKELQAEKESVDKEIITAALILIIGGAIFVGLLTVFIFKYEKKHHLREIKQQKHAAEKLSYQASHDPLTNLINRREFERRLQQLLEQASDNENHALLYLDLDQFKIINDTCGHQAGDELLKQLPNIFKSKLRNSDLLARIGGDEFAIILMSCDLESVKNISKTIIDSILEYQFIWNDKIFKIGVSIGIVEISDQTDSLQDILRFADSACYVAKDAGRNQYKIHTNSDIDLSSRTEEMDWLSNINYALEHANFILYAQIIKPIQVSSSPLKPSYEIFVRMNLNGQIIAPGAFLPAAERYNQIIDIDRYVVSNALSMINDVDFTNNIDHISINLSALSLSNKDFLAFLVSKISESCCPEVICFEITETAVINNFNNVIKSIKKLRSMGVRFSLDDFGSGLSSYAYLKQLDIDYLKIDGYFVKGIENDLIDRAMVKSMLDVGSVMGKKIIAEFVENDEILKILKILKGIGVDYAQGYGIGKPIPLLGIVESYQLPA